MDGIFACNHFLHLSTFCLCCPPHGSKCLFVYVCVYVWTPLGVFEEWLLKGCCHEQVYFYVKLCVRGFQCQTTPLITVTLCSVLLWMSVFCSLLPLWDFKAGAGCRIGGRNSHFVFMLQHFGSREEEGEERRNTKKSSFYASLVCLPEKTQCNVIVGRWSAKFSF